MHQTRFLLVTAAKNEEKYIGRTIESVAKQSLSPLEWIIIDDGSVDRTKEIVVMWQKSFPFITLIESTEKRKRSFASKAFSINEAVSRRKMTSIDYIGVLDADITLDQDYFEKLIGTMVAFPDLGIAGGVINELRQGKWVRLDYNYRMSVAGAVQMLRFDCYQEIGGYMALDSGGIDTVAEVMARMKGWKTETFVGLNVYHHRKIGGMNPSRIASYYKLGKQEYANGYSPLFQFARLLFRFRDRPLIIGSVVRSFGYLTSFITKNITKKNASISDEMRKYLRIEQRNQMLGVLPFRKRYK
jgi:poly-beta-1,6-N-acetyl-D-glucosamine synthase